MFVWCFCLFKEVKNESYSFQKFVSFRLIQRSEFLIKGSRVPLWMFTTWWKLQITTYFFRSFYFWIFMMSERADIPMMVRHKSPTHLHLNPSACRGQPIRRRLSQREKIVSHSGWNESKRSLWLWLSPRTQPQSWNCPLQESWREFSLLSGNVSLSCYPAEFLVTLSESEQAPTLTRQNDFISKHASIAHHHTSHWHQGEASSPK